MRIFSYLKRHVLAVSLAVIVVVGLAVVLGRDKGATSEIVATGPKKVQTVNVASFRKNSLLVEAQGAVESKSQADLKSQVSAPIAVIHANVGDYVNAGQVILELSNADLKASLEQAKASLALASGQRYTGGLGLDSAKSSAVDRIRDSYLKGYDAVNTQIDPILTNNDGNGGRLSSYISDAKLTDHIIETRIDLVSIFSDWKKTIESISSDSDPELIVAAIRQSSKNVATIEKLLGYISEALNETAKYSTAAFATSLNSWKSIVSGARASMSGASSALIAAEGSLTGAGASYTMTASAQVALAKAGVANLEAQLAKTIVRAPYGGRIASLPLRVGELASPGQLLSSVVGGGGLKVKVHVSGEDFSAIKPGAVVMIDGKFKGSVTSVSPSLNSSSRKAEVDIAVTDSDNSALVVGQSVSVAISASSLNSSIETTYLLPIQDIKIIPGSAYVFTIDDNSKLKKVDITLGQVQGDFIEVTGGLTDDLDIVTPVYELDEGEEVVVQ